MGRFGLRRFTEKVRLPVEVVPREFRRFRFRRRGDVQGRRRVFVALQVVAVEHGRARQLAVARRSLQPCGNIIKVL